MRLPLALALLLTCAACNRADAPAEEIAKAAEEIVDPAPQPSPLAAGEWAPRDTCAEVEGAEQFRAAGSRTRSSACGTSSTR